MMKKSLSALPNIGARLSETLIKAGIKTAEELKKTGSRKAIQLIHAHDNKQPCLNMLYALEGAIQDIRWHSLSKEKKEELKEFYEIMRKDNTKK
ncbi:MAG: TfoX/Sxy family DNA transformation protein [Bacteroidales bacterium]|nr:TfoX/Sxy family DNA transformation protein [Bacteroidales bacterium]